MKLFFVTLLALAAPAQETETERINAFFDRVFDEEVARSPMRQSQLGIKDQQHRWDDFSPQQEAREHALHKRNLGTLWTEFDYDSLDPQAQLSYRLFELREQRAIDDYEWRFHRYPMTQMRGRHTALVNTLLSMHRVDEVADAEAYVARLEGMAPPIDSLIERLTACAERGIVPPRFVFPHVLRDCRNVISGAPFGDPERSCTLLADFRQKLDGLGLDRDRFDALEQRATAALETVVGPAFERLITRLEELERIATTDDGCWKFPDGAAFYAQALQDTTTTKLTAREIHDLGLAQVARIHGEMQALREQVGFEGSLQAFFEHLRTDPRFYYPNTDEGRAAYLAEATRLVDVMRSRLDEFFRTKPAAEMIVKAVEPYREQSAGKAFYQRGAPDGSRPGVYYANLFDMASMPIYQMEALAYHEGIPGHHMQGSIAQELEDLPKFRKHSFFTAYGEGWGLYTERFPKEFGFYADPYSDFGRLAMELWRACRLVVDTGIHELRWTRREAIDYLLENTPNPEGDCVKAIERYIVMPSQATAYQIGLLEILRLRELAREELADRFDIRAFHDVLLTNGPVPLSILEELVRDWIESSK